MDAAKPRLERLLARVLRPFTKVQPIEAVTVGLMTLVAFLVLTAYYLLKTVREPLILLQGGAEVKLYARAGQTFIMMAVVYAYGELARHVGRMRLLVFVFLFFISNLAVFAVLARTELQIGLAFFLWVGVFSYTVVAQFWALAADIYTEEQGKRLFPIIGGGSSVGAVAGAALAGKLVMFGPPVLMATAVAILLACVALIVWVQRRETGSTGGSAGRTQKEAPDKPLSDESAFRLLAHDKYLLLIGGLVIFLNWVNSSGEYLLDRILVAASAGAAAEGMTPQQFVGAFKANYFAWYNAIGLLLQLFAVSRILQLVGVRKALFFMPFFSLIAYGAAVFFPVLAVIRLVKIGENSLQYSLQDTTRHALFLVATRVEKFVGKTAIDTVFVRLGAIMSALVVLTGSHFGWSTRTFAAICVVLATVWLAFALLIGKEHRHRVEEREALSVKEPTLA